MMSSQKSPKRNSEEDESSNLQKSKNSNFIQTCDDTSVNIPNENSVSQPTNENETLLLISLVTNFLIYIIINIIYVCVVVCFVLVAGLISTLILPALLVGFLVTRFLQFIKRGEECANVLLFKLCITFSISCALFFLLVFSGIMSIIVHSVPHLQHATVTGLSITKWIEVYCVVFGIYVASVCISLFLLFFLPDIPLDYRESGDNVSLGLIEIIDCTLFWLGLNEVTKRVSAFKQHKILELYTRKWIEALILVLIVYNVIALFTHFIVWVLRKNFTEKLDIGKDGSSNSNKRAQVVAQELNRTKYLLVYFVSGTRHSINFVFSSVVVLLVWVVYFGSHLNENSHAKHVMEFGTWTCSCLLFCALLWLIKTWVLLSWDAYSVYEKWKSKILEAGKQLYFLGIIAYNNYDIRQRSGELDEDEKYNEKKLKKKKELLKKDLLMHQVPSMYDIQQMGLYISNSTYDLSKDTVDIFEKLQTCSQAIDDGNIEEYIKRLLKFGNNTDVDEINERKFFEDQLREHGDPSHEISFERRLEIWMEKSRNHCLFLANTLKRANAVVDCLNKIISWLIIASTFILWLLLTKLASTKVLVLILSQMVAAAFIFGETCKTLFQGIIFVYVVHPFDVGDLCLIDDILMEVKTVGVWTTTFSKICEQEELTYSNLELSKKNCINYKTEFNWNDHVKFEVTSLDNKAINDLKEIIEEHLNNVDSDKQKFKPGYNSVEVLPLGNNITIAVNCRHNGNYKNYNYFQCYKEKCDLRSDFVLFVQNHLININISEFNWDEHVKFDVTSIKKEKIADLKEKIEELLANDIEKFEPGYNHVEELIIGDEIKKIVVNYKHNVKLENSSYLKCFKKKRRLRFEFVHRVQELIDQTKTEESEASDSGKKTTET